MISYTSAGVGFVVGAFVGCAILVLVLKWTNIFGPRRNRVNRQKLNRFNFDKQKHYEKEGRKFPFSY